MDTHKLYLRITLILVFIVALMLGTGAALWASGRKSPGGKRNPAPEVPSS